MASDLIVRILGDSKGLQADLATLKGRMSQATSSVAGMGKVAGMAGLAIGGVLVAGMAASVDVAMKGQAAQASLNAALKATHQSVSAMTPALDSAEAAGRNLGFANDDTRLALTKLETAFGNTKTAVADLSVAEDLARFKHVDLGTAAQALAMAHAGSTKALKQLGIIVQPVTAAMDALKAAHGGTTKGVDAATIANAKLKDKIATGAAAVAQVSKAVAGQSAAYAGTAQGGMAKFHAQIGNIEEKLGTMLLPVLQAVTQWISKMATWMSNHAGIVKIVVIAIGILAGALLVMSGAMMVVNTVMAMNVFGIIVIAIAALVVGIIYCWTHFQTFRDIVKDVFSVVSGIVTGFVNFFITTLPNAFRTVINWVRGNWPLILVLISGPFAPIVALATNAFGVRSALTGAFSKIINDVGGFISSIVGFFITLPGRIIGALASLPSKMGSVAAAAAKAFVKGLASIPSAIISSIGGSGGPGLSSTPTGAGTAGGPTSFGQAAGGSGKLSAAGLPGGTHQAYLESEWLAAGGTRATMLLASAIGMAESGGNPNAMLRDSNGTIDRGLWQINSIWGGLSTFDPLGNARAAMQISHGGRDWTPWTTYNTGAYRRYMAAGGIVTQPTNAVIGEAGPEAVIPLNGKYGLGGGKRDVSVTVNGYVGNRHALINQLRNEFVALGKREGSVFKGYA